MMSGFVHLLRAPWPWYVAGPLIGLLVPALLLLGNRMFGVSSSFRHICAATVPANLPYFSYDWRAERWNLWLVAGIVLGGWLAAHFLDGATAAQINPRFAGELASQGIDPRQALLPAELFGWQALHGWRGWVVMVGGGLLVGFGVRYANGCTSGHTITGIATLQRASLLASLAFFAGGLLCSWLILPLLLRGGP